MASHTKWTNNQKMRVNIKWRVSIFIRFSRPRELFRFESNENGMNDVRQWKLKIHLRNCQYCICYLFLSESCFAMSSVFNRQVITFSLLLNFFRPRFRFTCCLSRWFKDIFSFAGPLWRCRVNTLLPWTNLLNNSQHQNHPHEFKGTNEKDMLKSVQGELLRWHLETIVFFFQLHFVVTQCFFSIFLHDPQRLLRILKA